MTNNKWLGDLDSNQDWRSRESAVLPLDDPPRIVSHFKYIRFAALPMFCSDRVQATFLRSSRSTVAFAS